MDKNYKVSDTTLEATWVKKKIVYSDTYVCSNCNTHADGNSHVVYLTDFCSKCGARMTNPGIKHIDVEYEDYY